MDSSDPSTADDDAYNLNRCGEIPHSAEDRKRFARWFWAFAAGTLAAISAAVLT